MTDIILRRSSSAALFDTAAAPHPGLCLSKGIAEWKEDKGKKGEAFQAHVAKVADLDSSEIYLAAYNRWHRIALESSTIFAWFGKLDGRLFIGLGGPSVIETAITLSRTYGVPFIPGSAQKGLAQAYAKASGLSDTAREVLFGKEGLTPDTCDAGYVLFHDAWWEPNSAPKPLAQEIVTVHHPDYYQDGGASDATDFDSPVPNVQIAARGGFLFTVECADPAWAATAIDLLAHGLQEWGIGGKTASGYGRFVPNRASMRPFEEAAEAHAKVAAQAGKSENQLAIASLRAAFAKLREFNRKGGVGSSLYQQMKRLLDEACENSAGIWSEAEKHELFNLVEMEYPHTLRLDSKEKEVKKLLQLLRGNE
ncbi:MAG: type III-B CRISPR module RAMP protein Cmr6 [Sulfuricella sp.]